MGIDKKAILLTLEERAICERVSIADQAPHNQRAQALLALDEGLGQTEAGERAGLTAGQVKYWLSRFRQQRTGIFPEELQAQPTSTQPVSVKAPEKEPKQAEETIEEAQPVETGEKKTKKSKKAKGKKVKEKSSKKKKKDSKKKVAKKAKNEKKKDRKKKKSKKVKKGNR